MAERNRDTAAARAFHDATKYLGVIDEQGVEHFMMGMPPDLEAPIWQEDWSLEPYPFKVYETLDPAAMSALDAIARTGSEPQGSAIPDRAVLA